MTPAETPHTMNPNGKHPAKGWPIANAFTSALTSRDRKGAGPSTRRAFTLIEVLVIVVVMGIAAMVVVPQLLRDGSLGVQAAARMIIADLLVAQNEAIARHSTHTVVFEVDQNRYRIVDAAGDTVVLPVRDGPYVVNFNLDPRFRGVQIDAAEFGSTSEIGFDELGGPVPLAGGTIDISSGVHTYRIHVAAFTGRVTVKPL